MRPAGDDDLRPSVFVSRPSVVTQAQRELEKACLTGLAEFGFAPMMLRRDDYASNPWAQLRRAVSAAHGAVILGFRQLRVDRGEWRPDTLEAREVQGWLPTPWNQVEAGLAIMAGLPVLVVPEDGIVEGVFSSDTWGSGVNATTMDLWASPSAPADPSLRAWALAVRRRAQGDFRTRSLAD
jgi:hypothetical protein